MDRLYVSLLFWQILLIDVYGYSISGEMPTPDPAEDYKMLNIKLYRMLEDLNKLREEDGEKPLCWNLELQKLADSHVNDIAENIKVPLVKGSDGSTPKERLRKSNFHLEYFREFDFRVRNIESEPTRRENKFRTREKAFTHAQESYGKKLLTSRVKYIGMAYVDGKNFQYWSVIFAAGKGNECKGVKNLIGDSFSVE